MEGVLVEVGSPLGEVVGGRARDKSGIIRLNRITEAEVRIGCLDCIGISIVEATQVIVEQLRHVGRLRNHSSLCPFLVGEGSTSVAA